jgi:protein-tyrosine-phosphatase
MNILFLYSGKSCRSRMAKCRERTLTAVVDRQQTPVLIIA